MSDAEKKKRGIQTLPGNLYEAIHQVENSDLVREALGNHIYYKFIDNKKIEWDAYRTHISQFEINKYLPIT
jgi:glutamine synthetase